MADENTREEWAIRSPTGIFECRDEEHALAMMRSTSPFVGLPISERKVVHRTVTPWVDGPNQPKES